MLDPRSFTPGALAAALLLVAGACRHIPTEKELQGAQIHYDLGVNVQQAGDVQAAYKEYQRAIALDPRMAEAHNALGVLLHLSFGRPEEAVVHYKRALEIRPTFSEARTNLANVYLDQGRHDEAIRLYEEVLNDMLYSTPYIAQGNLGWAFYMRRDPEQKDLQRAVEMIKAAVTTNPKFCLGYKNLGIIHFEQGQTEAACGHFGKYRELCPDAADAYKREGLCQAKLGQNDLARNSFAQCQARSATQALKEDCQRLLEQLP